MIPYCRRCHKPLYGCRCKMTAAQELRAAQRQVSLDKARAALDEETRRIYFGRKQ